MSKKTSTVIKGVLLLFGIGGIIGGLFSSDLSLVNRIFYVCAGATVCVIALVSVVRWVAISLLAFSVGIAGIPLIFAESGQFDLAGLLTVISCIAVGIYFSYKTYKQFKLIGENQIRASTRKLIHYTVRSALAFVTWLLLTIILLQIPSFVETSAEITTITSPIPVFVPLAAAVVIFCLTKKPLNHSKIFYNPDAYTHKTTQHHDSVGAALHTIDLMEGHAFEYWCADLLSKLGYVDVTVTKGSGDQGVDVLAQKDGIKYAIQCKCYSSNLGNTPVQEVNTGKLIYHCHVGAVMTNRYFTSGAKEAAEATGVLLWDRDWIANSLKSIAPQSTSVVENTQPAPASVPKSQPPESPQERAPLASYTAGNISDPKPAPSAYTSVQPLLRNLERGIGDALLPAAVNVVLETGQVSVSILQRRLKLGYARAARIVDEMEEKGIVGPFQGSKPRDILITTDQWALVLPRLATNNSRYSEEDSDVPEQAPADEQFIAEAQWYATRSDSDS